MTTRPQPNPWIAYRKPLPRARLRLFCFPYAGGGASIYRGWAAELPEEIEVCPVQLPGREQRLREKAFTRVEPLIAALADGLAAELDRPFAFFGHSMGALLAFELAHRLRAQQGPEPVHIVASARRAPQLPPDEDKTYLLPEPEFRAKLREIEGTPEAVLEHEELMELLSPLLRADFELNDTYEPFERPALDCPITALGGLEDPDVTREHVEAWGKVTTGHFRLRMFPGHHFFLHDHDGRASVIRAVTESLLL